MKIILSRLNLPYSFTKRLGFVFVHGQMNEFDYSNKIFNMHMSDMKKYVDVSDPTIMEIGCGDSVSTALYARMINAKEVFLVDVDSFATKDLQVYKNLYSKILTSQESSSFLDWTKITTFNCFMKACKAKYMTNGLKSLSSIPDNSVDYIFSHVVMEHVRLSELNSMINEMTRVLKPGGVMSHNIDYMDHLSNSLNNLRFSEDLWESDLFAKSGFYTNRVPAIEMHKKFKDTGLTILEENFGKWEPFPLDIQCMDKTFQLYACKNLLVPTSNVVLQK